MDYLYRVVPESEWREALRSGAVPRCPADRRRDRVHLNSLKDVELAANLWFSAEEEPLALEVDVADLNEHLKWEAREEPPEGLWPNLYVSAIPVRNVVRVLTFVQRPDEKGLPSFQLGPALAAPGVQGVALLREAPPNDSFKPNPLRGWA